jgi:hypothetical protein
MASADTLLEGNHVGTDTRGINAVIASPLATGGAHVDAASGLVAGDSDYDIVSELEPTMHERDIVK